MVPTTLILQKTDLVLAGTNTLAEYTPSDGEKLEIPHFEGSAPGSSKAQIVLLWDGAKKWAIQDDEPMPKHKFFEVEGDGVKKLTLCLSNGCTGDYLMSGIVRFGSKGG